MRFMRSRLPFHQPRENHTHLKLGCYLIFSCLNNDAAAHHRGCTDYIIAGTLPDVQIIYTIEFKLSIPPLIFFLGSFIVGWGRVYKDYLLVTKIIGEPAPTSLSPYFRGL
jgi:hypothetical protein